MPKNGRTTILKAVTIRKGQRTSTRTGLSIAQGKDSELCPLPNACPRMGVPWVAPFVPLLQLAKVSMECALPLQGQSLAFFWLEGSCTYKVCFCFVSAVGRWGGLKDRYVGVRCNSSSGQRRHKTVAPGC